MSLPRTTAYFCGILLLLWDANAQCTCGTTSVVANSDPHYFNLCENSQETTIKCPPLTLYVQGIDSTTAGSCYKVYGGCSYELAGCVPCQYFPWLGEHGSMTAPACSKIGPVAPYCDPSYYWFCTSVYGTAELRACPSGYGFTANKTVGCATWYTWNQQAVNP